MGALDGTHIPSHVPAADGAPYRNRKGVLSHNVLGICIMDMQFCYVLAGWEGSAHDDKVLENALFDKHFIIPKKNTTYTGYHNTNYFLFPYCGVRYHLKEQAMADYRPANKEELFNLHHFSLQNVVERIFGVTKCRFQILETPVEFIMDIQVKMVLEVTGLYNFIQSHRTTRDIYDKTQLDAEHLLMRLSLKEEEVVDQVTHTSANTSREDGSQINQVRDQIAEAIK